MKMLSLKKLIATNVKQREILKNSGKCYSTGEIIFHDKQQDCHNSTVSCFSMLSTTLVMQLSIDLPASKSHQPSSSFMNDNLFFSRFSPRSFPQDLKDRLMSLRFSFGCGRKADLHLHFYYTF